MRIEDILNIMNPNLIVRLTNEDKDDVAILNKELFNYINTDCEVCGLDVVDGMLEIIVYS